MHMKNVPGQPYQSVDDIEIKSQLTSPTQSERNNHYIFDEDVATRQWLDQLEKDRNWRK